MDFEEKLKAEIKVAQNENIDASGIWELFENSMPQQRVVVFQRALEADVLDDDFAFELLETIRGDHDFGLLEDRALYTNLLNQLRERAPELYELSSMYYHRDLINFAIIERRWDDIPALLIPYASGKDLDLFFQVIAQLKYHGQIKPLINAMKTAWPKIRDSSEYFAGGKEEFARELMLLLLFKYLEESPDPDPDDPRLKEFTEHLLQWDEDWLNWFIWTVAQLETGQWVPADFTEIVKHEDRMKKIENLLGAFIAEQWRAGLPLSRGWLAWSEWSEIFKEQTKAFRKAKGKKKAKKKKQALDVAGLLIPQSSRMDKILGKSFSFIHGEPYEVIAALELIPAYLQFLEELALIQSADREHALKQIRPLVENTPQITRYYGGDQVAIQNLLGAWGM